ncbi:mitoferrin-2A-like isoform X3 [Oncorhynchus clarkii lewisi]|uniref:mitoferrin-2A-like isoform X3 n=1 Tax=Oncorhynchus clarkii lewisi TaxID=490388 RepID=UPI0039B9BD27
MEADGFLRRRRMTAERAGRDAGVAGASAGAEVRWLGGRIWGVSESLVGSLSPRIGGETEIKTVIQFSGGAPEVTLADTSEPDYEGLPQGASTSTHMVAGAVAGIMEHCLMFPIDCVKTRMQSLQPDPAARYRNVMDALRRIITTEGVWRPMRGLNATAVGAGPAHALYFACYEKLKKSLGDIIHPGANSHLANGQLTVSSLPSSLVSRSRERQGVAGCVSTLLHDAAMNPSEGAPLHDLRVPPGAPQPPQTVQPLLTHGVWSPGRGHRCCSHHPSGCLQDSAQHPGVPGGAPRCRPGWRSGDTQTHHRPGPCLPDSVQAGWPAWVL